MKPKTEKQKRIANKQRNKTKETKNKKPKTHPLHFVGSDKGQRHRLGGCSGLLSRFECDSFYSERGECSPFDQTFGTDYSTKHNGNSAFA